MLSGVYKIFNDRWCKQTVWIYSDPHFNDEEQRKMCSYWPQDDEQVKRINSKVGSKDTLILLGDCGDLSYVRKLRGYKILIMGNHDTGASKYWEYFDEVYEGALIIGEKLILSHEPVSIPWALNIHGHCHDGSHRPDTHHINVCSNVIDFTPINLNQLLKSGPTSKITTLHRSIIDGATKRKKRRQANGK